jgi:hypothetical protein
LDLGGKVIRIKAEGLLAQALEHETDHLNGILYIDRLVSRDKLWKITYEPQEDEPQEDEPQEEEPQEEGQAPDAGDGSPADHPPEMGPTETGVPPEPRE